MREQFINGIYNNCIDMVLENFDESMRKNISLAYKRFLLNKYKITLKPEDDIKRIINIFTKIEIKRWKEKTLDEKLSILFEDEFLNKLREISNIGFEYAQRKLDFNIFNQEYTPEISPEQADDYINKMEELFEKVQPYNKDEATMYLSEGTVDFKYASNTTEYMSLRTAQMR